MREEIIVSGRMNKGIDPVLHVWGWEIAVYLFLGGLAAGLLIYASYYALQKKSDEYRTTVRWAPLLVPFLIVLGLLALFIDLRHKLYFWQLYTTIRLESPMGWGAWTLMIITPISIAWGALQLKVLFPTINLNAPAANLLKLIMVESKSTPVNWEWRYKWLIYIENFLNKHIKVFSWVQLVYAVILGIYTGILLSAFNARPLWNTSILGPLFLTSGLSTAAATIMLLTKNHDERKQFSKIDLVMIIIELFLITHMFMGFLASTQVQIQAAQLFLGGDYTVVFWVFVVILGLIIPAFLEILELRGYKIPVVVPALLVLMGGIVLRFVIVYAGQASRYLY